GYIDYSLGAPVEYVPLHQVASMDEATLNAKFNDRLVLIGSLIKDEDRWRLPVVLMANDPAFASSDGEAAADRRALNQPGVLVHLQALRSHFGPGLLHPLPQWLAWSLCALAAIVVLIRHRPSIVVLGAFVVPAPVLVASL